MTGSVVARSRIALRPLALALLLVLFVAAQFAGLTGDLGVPDALRETLVGSGLWGAALFVLVFALSHLVGLPSVLLVLLAGSLWPLWAAVSLSWAGGMLATSLAYGVAAWAGHDWAMRRLPPRLRRLDRRLAGRGALAVLGTRLLLLTPPPADWFCGVTSIRYRDFLGATSLGLVPPTLVLAVVGSGEYRPVTLAAAIAGGAVSFALAALLQARRRRTPSGGRSLHAAGAR